LPPEDRGAYAMLADELEREPMPMIQQREAISKDA
jgi:hypothetical protein